MKTDPDSRSVQITTAVNPIDQLIKVALIPLRYRFSPDKLWEDFIPDGSLPKRSDVVQLKLCSAKALAVSVLAVTTCRV